MEAWLLSLQEAQKTCIVDEDKKKVHYKFKDGREMVEEYNEETNVLLKRAWKLKNTLRNSGDWEIEIGDPDTTDNSQDAVAEIWESNASPLISTRMTKEFIEWRIRNLPYPIETYSVVCNKDENCIVVSTTNKKYYKRIKCPDLDRLNLPYLEKNISYAHRFKTLIISYAKPIELKMCEKLTQQILLDEQNTEGQVQCPTS